MNARWLLIGAALLVAPAVCYAQDEKGKGGRRFGMGGMGGGGTGIELLANTDVQKELKLTDEERSNIELLRKEIEDSNQEFREKLQDMSREERGEKMRERQKEQMKMVAEVLGDKTKRFNQVRHQVAGVFMSMMSPENKEALKVTDEQTETLREKFAEAFQGGGGFKKGERPDPEAIAKMMTDARKKQTETAMGLMTEDQKKLWKEMIGEPITFEVKPQFGGRFGGKGKGERGEKGEKGGRKKKEGDDPPPAV